MNCQHLQRKEYTNRLFKVQVCMDCDAVREYNPGLRKCFFDGEKQYPKWSEWHEDESLKKALDSFGSRL